MAMALEDGPADSKRGRRGSDGSRQNRGIGESAVLNWLAKTGQDYGERTVGNDDLQ